MKLYEIGSLVILIIVAACAIAGAISVKFFGPDNLIEEISEEVIEQETGIHVDISPESSPSISSKS